jgi:addiction module RelE/StbE family toxin
MAQVVWSERAVADLEQIGSYIAKDSVRYAGMVVGKLFSRTEILKTNPYLGRMVPEFSNAAIRELIEGSYRIVYQVNSAQDAVQIITVHHSKIEFLLV